MAETAIRSMLHPLLVAAATRVPTNNTTGVVSNASELLRRIPLRQLRLLVPDDGEVWGQGAITLVLSRAVIELGSNFKPLPNALLGDPGDLLQGGGEVQPLVWVCNGPSGSNGPPIDGRTWWVTTSIVRFDPSAAWSNDLKCTVAANPKLQSYDGTRINTSTIVSGAFHTQPLMMYVAGVTSKLADAATAGQWQSRLANEQSDECPSDCVMRLSFSHPVDLARLHHALCLQKVGAAVGPCLRVTSVSQGGWGSDTSVSLTFPSLDLDTEYELALPAHTIVTNVSGPTAARLSTRLHGLRPFSFPWLPSGPYGSPIASKRASLVRCRLVAGGGLYTVFRALTVCSFPLQFVRHGLSPNTSATTLQRALSVNVTHSSILQESPTELLALGDYSPSINYRFQPVRNPSTKRTHAGLRHRPAT